MKDEETANTEISPLVNARVSRNSSPATTGLTAFNFGWTAALLCVYAMVSISLINYNKFLMHEERFPHAVPLTWLHQLVQAVFGTGLYLCFGDKVFPRIDVLKAKPGTMFATLIPMAIAMVSCVTLSNQAYYFCSVPFLQISKSFTVPIIYTMGVIAGLEVYTARSSVLLLIVACSSAVAIRGEPMISWVGLMLQFGSDISEGFYVIMMQIVLQNHALDAMTTVTAMGFLCFGLLSMLVAITWDSQILTDAAAIKGHLMLNGCCAFALNILTAVVVKHTSALACSMTHTVKNIGAVVIAAVVFHQQVTGEQFAGYSVAMVAITTYSLLRIQPLPEVKYRMEEKYLKHDPHGV